MSYSSISVHDVLSIEVHHAAKAEILENEELNNPKVHMRRILIRARNFAGQPETVAITLLGADPIDVVDIKV